MKHKFACLFGVAAFALTMSGCKQAAPENYYFLRLYVSQTKSPMVAGDLFFNCNEVELRAYARSGATKLLDQGAVQFILKYEGMNRNVYNPLAAAGNYELFYVWNGMTSNTYSFDVIPQKVYATSVEIDGPNKIPYNRTERISLNITPSNYTEDVIYYGSSNLGVATIEQVDKLTYDITTYSMGVCSFLFSVYTSEFTTIEIPYNLTVTEIYATSITTRGPSYVGINSKVQVTVDVEPADCSVEVGPRSFNEDVATVEQIDDRTFEITGHQAGHAEIKFYVLDSQWTNINAQHDIYVQTIGKTDIEQTYMDLVKLNPKYSCCPNAGDVQLLVIPIWFSDSSSFISPDKKDTVAADIYNAVFGTRQSTNWHSVASFYHEESNGELNITGTVGDWYEPKIDDVLVASSYYQNDSDGRTKKLVKAAVDDYFANNSDSRTKYDYDGDGYLDGVLLFYAAPDYQSTGDSKNNLWAYKTSIGNQSYKDVNTPGPNTFFWCSYDFLYGSNIVKDHTGFNYYHGNTVYSTIDANTVIHEMGHIFGLNDYYDYCHNMKPAGYFSTQDANGGGHDPFSSMALGWADPFIPTESCTIKLNDFQSSGEVILLTPEFNPYNSPFDEYLLLELYTPTGLNYLDAGLKGVGPRTPGIRLWHVDAILYKTTGTNFTRNVFDNGVTTTAFNNTSRTKAQDPTSGRDCEAYYRIGDDFYQNFHQLHLIRKIASKDFECNNMIVADDLFVKDDIFTFNTYKNQFVKPYFSRGDCMDFGQQLGWEFTVGEIEDHLTGQYSVTITLTKTA